MSPWYLSEQHQTYYDNTMRFHHSVLELLFRYFDTSLKKAFMLPVPELCLTHKVFSHVLAAWEGSSLILSAPQIIPHPNTVLLNSPDGTSRLNTAVITETWVTLLSPSSGGVPSQSTFSTHFPVTKTLVDTI